MQQFISGKESMTALIWHSPDLKVIVSRRAKVRRMDAEFLRHSGMRDLQSAKHRHSSLQKPMGRFILLADAFLATAHERLSRHQACLSMSPFQRKTVLQS